MGPIWLATGARTWGATRSLYCSPVSTAEPNGVPHSHRRLLHDAHQAAGIFRLRVEDVVFMASPMIHNTGLVFGAALPVHLAVTSAC